MADSASAAVASATVDSAAQTTQAPSDRTLSSATSEAAAAAQPDPTAADAAVVVPIVKKRGLRQKQALRKRTAEESEDSAAAQSGVDDADENVGEKLEEARLRQKVRMPKAAGIAGVASGGTVVLEQKSQFELSTQFRSEPLEMKSASKKRMEAYVEKRLKQTIEDQPPSSS